VSPEVVAATEDLEPLREELFAAQADAGLTRWNESLMFDLRFAGARAWRWRGRGARERRGQEAPGRAGQRGM
jgi:hypothetical protein